MKTISKEEDVKESDEYQYNKLKKILPGGFVFFQCPRSSNIVEKALGAGEKITVTRSPLPRSNPAP